MRFEIDQSTCLDCWVLVCTPVRLSIVCRVISQKLIYSAFAHTLCVDHVPLRFTKAGVTWFIFIFIPLSLFLSHSLSQYSQNHNSNTHLLKDYFIFTSNYTTTKYCLTWDSFLNCMCNGMKRNMRICRLCVEIDHPQCKHTFLFYMRDLARLNATSTRPQIDIMYLCVCRGKNIGKSYTHNKQ